MRPLRLRIDGFTSFRQPQEIDFSELDLFAIVGPTGSGKSSILDAMTLALYGSVPRANDHQVKDLISLGVGQAKVELEFEVDGRRYRVARKLPRKGAQAATFERLEGDQFVTAVDAGGVKAANQHIVEVIGLDYDAFIRAVLLPQGEFAEFLAGDAPQRRNILIRLLDLDRFVRAGKKANEQATLLEHQVKAHETAMATAYAGVDDAAIAAADAAAESARKRTAALELALAEAFRQRAEHDRIASTASAVATLARKTEERRRDLQHLESEASGLDEREASTRAALSTAATARELAESSREAARAARDESIRDLGDPTVLAALAEKSGQLTKIASHLDALRAESADLATERTGIEAQLAQHATLLADALSAETAAEKSRADAASALASAEAERRRAARYVQIQNDLADANERVVVQTGKLAAAERVELEAEAAVVAAKSKVDSVRAKHAASALRGHLHVGDDCPVCGGVVTELPSAAVDAHEVAEADATADTAQKALVKSTRETARVREALASARDTVAVLEEAVTSHGDVTELSTAEHTVVSAEAAARAAEDSWKQARREREEAAGLAANSRTALAAIAARFEGVERQIKSAGATIAECQARLAEQLGDPLPSDYAEEIERRRRRLTEVGRAFEAAQKSLDAALKEEKCAAADRDSAAQARASIASRVASQLSMLEEYRGEFNSLKAPKVPAFKGSHESAAEVLAGADRLAAACTKAAASLEGARTEVLTSLREVAEALHVDAAGKEAGPVVDGIGRAKNAAEVAAARAEDAHTNLVTQLAKKTELEGAIAGDRERMLLYEKVGRELHQNRFIKFLLDESFTDLALRASDELRQISGSRYSLVAEGDSFEVVDHSNADETRSVATLSGGETFLASLALALALAQGITDIAGHAAAARLESMFIDEGFGSLDPAALDLAVDALERIRETERLVGVVTHVPAMAERIPAGLEVMRGISGSVVQAR